VLPIRLSEEQVQQLFDRVSENEGYELTVDLEQREISDAHGFNIEFQIDAFRREALLEGLDDIALTLAHDEKIASYEARRGME
jgi:3-isopropylmalate/(R)-2-methylmalate dehydratase small subunit